MSVALMYQLLAAPGKTQELLTLLQAGRDFALTVEGCEGYAAYQGQDDPHTLVMIEHWTSVEAQQKHFENNVKASGVFDRAMALMAGPPEEAWYLLR